MTLLTKLFLATGIIGTASSVPAIISLTSNKSTDLNYKVEKVEENLVNTAEPSTQEKEQSIQEEISSSPKSELEKLKERAENTNLCREVASSTYDGSYLRVCKENENSSNVEFEYYVSKYSMPSPIKHLKFGSSEIVITLKEKDSYGPKVVRMDLPREMLTGSGLFSSFAGGKDFTNKQCKLENVHENSRDWRINCQQII